MARNASQCTIADSLQAMFSLVLLMGTVEMCQKITYLLIWRVVVIEGDTAASLGKTLMYIVSVFFVSMEWLPFMEMIKG